ncbi:MAG TPA: 4-(cytidine 5'-diphospho)-2-C-methyl-D-erythritol kinase [Bryobacteraceae bacterium]|jgi:4-diphosphocytidyl-2-C-methyl-D-erythritol kinase|nr:4-(cytidine 5'-diphospho)-2-C-methyl-D-erythritol kinase [Bryobacteraceae bacterium]
MTRTARLRAYAKLNLGLRVLYKRPDGYHELRTVFQTISLADTLNVRFTRARQTRIEIEGTPEIPDNLVEKATRLALEAMEIHGDVRFQLRKNIPSGAGLGGGSSDAAAVLLALPVLAGRVIPAAQLFPLAAQLGSDVPFFLEGGTALGLGRGEELYPLPSHRVPYALLIAPRVHSSTAEAYRDLSGQLTSIALQNKLQSFQQQLWRGSGVPGFSIDENDFEPVVFARHPELKKIRERLVRAGATVAAMTGSGSSLFGIFRDAAALERAKKLFDRDSIEERVFPISFVSGRQYRSAWNRSLRPYLGAKMTAAAKPGTIKNDIWPPRSAHA